MQQSGDYWIIEVRMAQNIFNIAPIYQELVFGNLVVLQFWHFTMPPNAR